MESYHFYVFSSPFSKQTLFQNNVPYVQKSVLWKTLIARKSFFYQMFSFSAFRDTEREKKQSNCFRMSVPSVNIRISGRNDFICPVDKRVEAVVDAIRSEYGLTNGGIKKNGVAMFPDDIITNDGEYHFVNFQELQGM